MGVNKQKKKLDNSLLDGIPIGIYRSAPDGQFFEANKALVKMLNYANRESLLAINATKLYKNSVDRKQWQDLIEREGVVHDFEVQWKTSDGQEIWIEENARAIRRDDGHIIYYEGSLQDITWRKQAEQELKKSEERFRSAMEYAAIGKALVAPDGRWLKVNHSLCKMLGYSEDELLNIDFQTVTHPADLESDLDYVSQMLAGEIETYQMEKRYIHKQGNTVWVLLSVSLVHDCNLNIYFSQESRYKLA